MVWSPPKPLLLHLVHIWVNKLFTYSPVTCCITRSYTHIWTVNIQYIGFILMQIVTNHSHDIHLETNTDLHLIFHLQHLQPIKNFEEHSMFSRFSCILLVNANHQILCPPQVTAWLRCINKLINWHVMVGQTYLLIFPKSPLGFESANKMRRNL